MWGKSGYYLTVQLKEDEAKDTHIIHASLVKKKLWNMDRTKSHSPNRVDNLVWSFSGVERKIMENYSEKKGFISMEMVISAHFNHENYCFFTNEKSKTD